MGIGGCTDHIATAGCLITAFSMVLDYYEVELVIPATSSSTQERQRGMNPAILNDWLRGHGGYGYCPHDQGGKCCLEWNNLPPQVDLSRFYENQSESGIDPESRRIIDRALVTGKPVIAGVHWGAHCHGSRTKTEDCHWIVITGKTGDTYWIIDPYNRDYTSKEGIQTTLATGVFGNYIIDRFVVVSGPVPKYFHDGLRIELLFEPESDGFLPGDLQRRLFRINRSCPPVALYSRVIDPQGMIYYTYYAKQFPDTDAELLVTRKKTALYPHPIQLESGIHEWNRTRISGDAPGTWTWELWIEDPNRPGRRLAGDIASYTVIRKGAQPVVSPDIFAVGTAAVLALAITVVLYVLFATNRG
jgi:hypothetical protein